MRTNSRLKSFLYIAGVAILPAWTALGQQPRRFDDSVLRDAPKAGKEWLSYGLDLAETRYADKGRKLFEVQTGLGRGMGPPITFEIDGKQYISLMGGTGVTERYGRSANAPPPPPSPSSIPPRLLTFVLDGKAQLPGAPPMP